MTTTDEPILRPTPATPEPTPRRRSRRGRREVSRPLVPVEVELTGFADGGRAVGHAPDGRVVFVEYGIPGERVVAEITADHPGYLEATAVQVLRPSAHRVVAPCQYFGRCGGCQLQHIDYAEQLRLKSAVVREQLVRIGRFDPALVADRVRDMAGMDGPWGYRNHVRFTVRRDGDVGFMQRGTHRFMRIDRCAIATDRVNAILAAAQGRTMQARQLTIRVGEHTGEVMVQPRLQWRPGRRATGVESGQPCYHETLLGVPYRISGPAFFQVNTRQAERLVALVIDRVEAVQPRVVIDAYAGVGTFAAQLAPAVDHVVMIEESAAAGDDAEVNLAPFANVTRVVGKVEATLPGMTPAPDVVVIDPPRTGIAPEVVRAILDSTARRVVYVSCDPATLARDLRLLVDGGFALSEVQPVDMFPQTQHIECVAVLDRVPPPAPARSAG
ncbi:MAG: class I SAM-dependent RNA methyltransferase [Dehalococcoidia bacterium]|nr:class I SAM-dependent RNA methyltransferase [Dehalococcoidia bacterium]